MTPPAADVSLFTPHDPKVCRQASIWVVLSRRQADLGSLADSPRWRQLQGRADAKVWTDDYANVVAAFKWE